jgi:hypothetical protein
MDAFATAVMDLVDNTGAAPVNNGWTFHVAGDAVIDTLNMAGAELATGEPAGYMFIPLQAG